MGDRQEAQSRWVHEQAFAQHDGVESGLGGGVGKAHSENRPAGAHLRGQATALGEFVETLGQQAALFFQRRIERRPAGREMFERCRPGGKTQYISARRPRVPCHAFASGKLAQDIGPAGHRPKRETAADVLAVHHKIGEQTEPLLRATEGEAKADMPLVEDQQDSCFAAHLGKPAQPVGVFEAFNLMHLGPGALSQFFSVPEGAAAYLHQKTEGYAGFGEANYEVAPRLTLTAGVRWTHDKREANTNAHIFNATGFETTFIDETLSRARLLVPTIPAMTVMRAWSCWSGRGVASYEVSDNLLAYVQVVHGFKGGDFNGGALFGPAEANIVNPEYVLSTEAGLKGVAADGFVSFDIAAFRYGFSDQQVSVLVPASRATLQQLSNAAKTRVTGLDAEVQVRPSEALVFEARANLLDAQFTRFVFDSENPASNLAGKRPAFSPKVSFYGAARYTVPVRTGDVALQVDTSHKGAHFFTVNNIPALQQAGLWLFNASTRYAAADDRYSVAVWVKNIFDTDYFATGLANSALGFMELIPGPPRSFGVTLSAGF